MIVPIDTTIVVEIEKLEATSKGGLALPETMVERDQMSITEGVVRALGDLAYGEIKELGARVPKIGDKVYFKKYSGILHSDKKAGKEYRIIQDRDVYSIEASDSEESDKLGGAE